MSDTNDDPEIFQLTTHQLEVKVIIASRNVAKTETKVTKGLSKNY
jgi:hypothetical protein